MSETIVTKYCSKCKQIKPISEFHKNRANKDGHHYQCKMCFNQQTRRYSKTEQARQIHHKAIQRYRNSEKGKATIKHYNQSEKWKATLRSYIKQYPEREKAKSAVNNAIKLGKLPNTNILQCHYCPKPSQQYHHPSYAKEHWLDIIPVCISCHRKLHVGTSKDPANVHSPKTNCT